MTAKLLMIQGVASGVGKSTLVTALCRILREDGYRVAPFKAENMSLNAAVTADGSEIGRSQAVQALAAGVEAEAIMNPVLLKPEGLRGIQAVIRGRIAGYLSDLPNPGQTLWDAIVTSLDELCTRFDVVVIEGAGSPVEMNLRETDLANMRVATAFEVPVLLAADIDRGGVFASIVGTLSLLEPSEKALVKGLVINRFRGDREKFREGVDWLEQHTGIPVVGVVPDVGPLGLPEEDSVVLASRLSRDSWARRTAGLDIAVVAMPHISNFDEFQPLDREPGVSVRYIRRPEDLGTPDLVILPGTKSTVADLIWLRVSGLANAVTRFAGNGAVLGICGGYQMLGREIRDPDHVESDQVSVPGLGLLSVSTRFIGDKTTHQSEALILEGPGLFASTAGERVTGYEIHMGVTGSPASRQVLRIERRSGRDALASGGSRDGTGQVAGVYLHGLFHNQQFRRRFLAGLQSGKPAPPLPEFSSVSIEADLGRLANVVRESIDIHAIRTFINPSSG